MPLGVGGTSVLQLYITTVIVSSRMSVFNPYIDMYKYVLDSRFLACTIMYMKVHEFRKDLKTHFDTALTGQAVLIERGGVQFRLTTDFTVAEHDALMASARYIQATTNLGKNTIPLVAKKPKVPIEIVRNLFPQAKELCKVHGVPLTLEGRCLQKGCKYN